MNQRTSIIVLCGGAGRRLQGIDKPLLEINDIPIIKRIADALAGLGPLIISANRNLETYKRYGQVVTDGLPIYQGPLAGIAAGMRACETELAFVCPGDCPDISTALAQRLLNGLAEAPDQIQAVCAHDGDRRQQLHLALRTSTSEALASYLNSGERSVKGWLAQLQVLDMDCSDLRPAFADIDTRQALRDHPF